LALSIVKKGEKDIEGLTTNPKPNRLHVKRASKIRKLYNLAKEDDVKFYIQKIGREITKKEGQEKKKLRVKRPKIQRLITDVRIRRKKIQKVETNQRRERTAKLKEDYHKLISKLRSK
jgi:small subunit ribosomal protein S6e